MPRYEAVAHLLWELPFALRLPPHAFLCWEPAEGTALFDPRPGVGALAWRRTCRFLSPTKVFPDTGHPNECFPAHDYMITSVLKSGQEIPTANLTQGRNGGFEEARPCTVANLFLCLAKRSDYAGGAVIQRAAKALNNVIDMYRFLTLDPLARSIRADQDTYYTLVSMAELPPALGDLPPADFVHASWRAEIRVYPRRRPHPSRRTQ